MAGGGTGGPAFGSGVAPVSGFELVTITFTDMGDFFEDLSRRGFARPPSTPASSIGDDLAIDGRDPGSLMSS
jgi:hypothetical protein